MNGQEYKMEILGIGNAIVDVICKVDEDFIEVNNNKRHYETYFR